MQVAQVHTGGNGLGIQLVLASKRKPTMIHIDLKGMYSMHTALPDLWLFISKLQIPLGPGLVEKNPKLGLDLRIKMNSELGKSFMHSFGTSFSGFFKIFKYWIEKPESFLRFEKGGNSNSFSIMIHILLFTQHTSTIHLHDSIISYVI